MRLIYFTLSEYLSAHHDLPVTPHVAIAEICLTLLNSQKVRVLSTNLSADIPNASFLAYSVYYRVQAKREPSDCAESFALELFREFDSGGS